MDIRLRLVLREHYLWLGHVAEQELPPGGSLDRHLLVVEARSGTRVRHDECLGIHFLPRSVVAPTSVIAKLCHGGFDSQRTPILFVVDGEAHWTATVDVRALIRSGQSLLRALESRPEPGALTSGE